MVRARNQLKVFETVVGFYAVLVMDMMTFRYWSISVCPNQSVLQPFNSINPDGYIATNGKCSGAAFTLSEKGRSVLFKPIEMSYTKASAIVKAISTTLAVWDRALFNSPGHVGLRSRSMCQEPA